MNNPQHDQQLIERLRHPDNEIALEALQTLRDRGWRHTAYLNYTDLSYANLEGAPLDNTDLSATSFVSANLRRANFHKASITGADLSQADLAHAYLRSTDLSGTDLHNANMEGVRLDDASLSYARLRNANLHHAYLSSTDLSGAILSGANLTQANLSGANLSGADLYQANLSEAICHRTVFANVDLSEVIGLETVKHHGPSTLGIDTIQRSGGKIPLLFLRGCGVPENLITYLPSLIGQAIDFYSCFISYSHADKSFARRVYDTLQGRGIRCWLDEHQMHPGDDIYQEIERGIRFWDKVLLCASRHSLTSWWVDNELDTLFAKERLLMKERQEKVLALIPLDLDGYLFNEECQNSKKQQIQSRIAADFKNWEHDNTIFEREIERVIEALRTDSSKEKPPDSKL